MHHNVADKYPPPLALASHRFIPPLVYLLCRLKPKKVKNVSHDEFGETLGRIHMEKQDFGKLELKKTKASKLLKKRGRGETEGEGAEGAAAIEDDDEEEAVKPAAQKPAAKRARKAGPGDDDE